MILEKSEKSANTVSENYVYGTVWSSEGEFHLFLLGDGREGKALDGVDFESWVDYPAADHLIIINLFNIISINQDLTRPKPTFRNSKSMTVFAFGVLTT